MNFFTDHLIKVRFKIDTESFVCGTYINDKEERNYDYLLPLRVEALNSIDYHKLKIEYQESAKEVKVLLTLPGDNKPKTQVYRTQISTDNAEEKYTIIALEEYVANVNLDIFPFLQVVDAMTNQLLIRLLQGNARYCRCRKKNACFFYITSLSSGK